MINVLPNSMDPSTGNYFVSMVTVYEDELVLPFLSEENLAKYYSIFLKAITNIVEDFGAQVYWTDKQILLFYYPKTFKPMDNFSFSSLLELGFKILNERGIINESMTQEKLPPIKYRVSANYGLVIFSKQSDSSETSMYGPAANMCAKINRYAQPNGMVIGKELYEIVKDFVEYQYERVSYPRLDNDMMDYSIYSISQKPKS